MNILNIKYFIAIAEEQSISGAARKLFVSQQSLSEHLKKIEDELGCPLITRKKPLTLTVAGEVFYDSGKQLLRDYDKMLADIKNVTAHRKSNITIGIATYAEPPFLAELVTRFQRKYPQYRVTVVKRQHTDVIHNMYGVDLYISWLPVPEELEAVPVLDEDPYCVAFRQSLARKTFGDAWDTVEEELIRTQDLNVVRDLPFITLRDRYENLVTDLAMIFAEYHISPSVSFSSENGDLNIKMCANGAGALIAPGDYIERALSAADPAGSAVSRPASPASGGVKGTGNETLETEDLLLIYPIKVTSIKQQLAICYTKGKQLHIAEKSFILEAQEMFLA